MIQINPALGHGIGSEKLPPVQMGQKLVTVEVSSTLSSESQQMSIAFIDASNSVSIRNTTFKIAASKGETLLFDKTFKADDGIITIKLQDAQETKIEQTNDAGPLESLLGFKKNLVTAYGPNIASGGLYRFHINIIAAENYSNQLEPPITFDSAVSIPIQTDHMINDPNYGQKTLQTVSYYDKIDNFSYNNGMIKLSMPFSWNINEINQTSAVHVEIISPKSLGDLMTSRFYVSVNGREVSEKTTTIDDFTGDVRIIHIVMNQKDLMELYEHNKNKNKMDIIVRPENSDSTIETVTESGQFKIKLNHEPEDLRSGKNAKISFTVLDVFLSEKPISVSYQLSIEQKGVPIFADNGYSNSNGSPISKEFLIPESISGPIEIKFENMDGKSLARATLPLVVDRIKYSSSAIPEWIKNNAGWWSQNSITDYDFIKGIEYLIAHDIILIPDTGKESSGTKEIPQWVKNNAKWWSDGQIDEQTFINSIQFLINNGIIQA